MVARSKLSEKGQVVVPKGIRDRLRWPVGLDLEVIEGTDSVTFRRPVERRDTLTMEEAIVRLQSIYTHEGPPVPLEELSCSISDAVTDRLDRIR
jgi:AbrB family looped-hinge helix DNA binding protein